MPLGPLTIAVNVTDCPKIDGFCDEETMVVVSALTTVRLVEPLLLVCTESDAGVYVAVSVCVPVPTWVGVSVTEQVVAPVPFSCSVQGLRVTLSVLSKEVTLTVPSGSNEGVYSSALARAGYVEFEPPVMSTLAVFSRVAVSPERAAFISLEAEVNVPAAVL
jgi:hypothetical protein